MGNHISNLFKKAYTYKGEEGEDVPKNIGILAFAEGVKTIHASAFKKQIHLVTISNFPESLEIIDDYSFSGCSNLVSLPAFPKGLTRIGHGSFFRCSSLSIPKTFPAGIKLGDRTFYGCSPH